MALTLDGQSRFVCGYVLDSLHGSGEFGLLHEQLQLAVCGGLAPVGERQFNAALTYLGDRGLIEQCHDSGQPRWRLTEAGRDFRRMGLPWEKLGGP